MGGGASPGVRPPRAHRERWASWPQKLRGEGLRRAAVRSQKGAPWVATQTSTRAPMRPIKGKAHTPRRRTIPPADRLVDLAGLHDVHHDLPTLHLHDRDVAARDLAPRGSCPRSSSRQSRADPLFASGARPSRGRSPPGRAARRASRPPRRGAPPLVFSSSSPSDASISRCHVPHVRPCQRSERDDLVEAVHEARGGSAVFAAASTRSSSFAALAFPRPRERGSPKPIAPRSASPPPSAVCPWRFEVRRMIRCWWKSIDSPVHARR